jgi:putative transcriptional regulator
MAKKTKKTPRRKPQSRLTQELLETAGNMHASGLMTKTAHDKITKRHLGTTVPSTSPAMLKGRDIKALREKFHLSQAVFAHLLNLTAGYVSQLERDAKRPSGPALVLLDIIRRKGIEAIL